MYVIVNCAVKIIEFGLNLKIFAIALAFVHCLQLRWM